MRKRLLLGAAGAALLIALGLAGGYLYYFSGLRTAPRPFALATASPTPAATPPASAAPSGLSGNWTVGPGSLAGYRVREVFAGQASSHEAVARTSAVTGTVSLGGTQGSLAVTAATVTVDLGSLQSVDQVAGLNVGNRDRIVRGSLAVQQYPTATFTAAGFSLPAGLDQGSQVSLSVPGRLTIHGVTRDALADLQAQVRGDTVEITGSITARMTDFGVTPPSLSITAVDPGVTVEFQLKFVRTV